MRKKDLTGKRFGRLTVVSFSHKSECGKNYWVCHCDCGKEIITNSSNLITNQSKSCGCLRKKTSSLLHKKHGQSETRLYNVWRAIRSRCLLPNTKSYNRYGGRGIKICKEWYKNFEPFFIWSLKNGYKKGLTIDRIDNNGDYCPENCRWTTVKEQSKNRRNSVFYILNGVKTNLSDLLASTNFPESTYHKRIKSGKVKISEIFKGVDFNKFNIERIK